MVHEKHDLLKNTCNTTTQQTTEPIEPHNTTQNNEQTYTFSYKSYLDIDMTRLNNKDINNNDMGIYLQYKSTPTVTIDSIPHEMDDITIIDYPTGCMNVDELDMSKRIYEQIIELAVEIEDEILSAYETSFINSHGVDNE